LAASPFALWTSLLGTFSFHSKRLRPAAFFHLALGGNVLNFDKKLCCIIAVPIGPFHLLNRGVDFLLSAATQKHSFRSISNTWKISFLTFSNSFVEASGLRTINRSRSFPFLSIECCSKNYFLTALTSSIYVCALSDLVRGQYV